METRSNWVDLIAGVGVDIAEVFDEGQIEYVPGLGSIVQSLTGDGGQETVTGKTGVGELQKFTDGDNLPEGKRYKTYNTTIVWNNYGKYVDVTKNTIEDKDPRYKQALDEMKDLSISSNYSQDKSAMQLFNGGFSTTITKNGYDMTWPGDGVALFSSSHPSVVLGQANRSNLGTAATFNTINLETGIVALEEQSTSDGIPVSLLGKPVVVLPPALRKEGFEITESVLLPSTANNTINYYKDGAQVDMVVSTHLSNTFGGSDTAWFLTIPQRAQLSHILRQAPRLEQDTNIKNKVVTFTVDARWADAAKSWIRTWANQGA